MSVVVALGLRRRLLAAEEVPGAEGDAVVVGAAGGVGADVEVVGVGVAAGQQAAAGPTRSTRLAAG